MTFHTLNKCCVCSYDYLKIANEKNQSFGVYCGEMSGRTVGVTGVYAVIKFHSDGYVQRKGFRISFNTGSPGKKRFKTSKTLIECMIEDGRMKTSSLPKFLSTLSSYSSKKPKEKLGDCREFAPRNLAIARLPLGHGKTFSPFLGISLSC